MSDHSAADQKKILGLGKKETNMRGFLSRESCRRK